MEEKTIYLVERQEDLEAMRSVGIDNVVCYKLPIETALQWINLKVEATTVDIIFEALDSKEWERVSITAETLLKWGVFVRIVELDGLSPAKFISEHQQDGKEMEYIKYVITDNRSARDYITCLKNYTGLVGLKLDSYEKSEAIKLVAKAINKMSDAIRKHVYLNDFAKEVDVPMELLQKYLEKRH